MNIYKSYSFIIVLFCSSLCFSAVAQTENKYKASMDEIDEYLLAEEYTEALPMLINLVNSGFSNENIDYKLGLCYLNSVKGKANAIRYFESASKNIKANCNDTDSYEKCAPVKTLFCLGDAYRLNNRLTDAEHAYKMYVTLVKNNQKEQMLAENRLAECRMARLFTLKPIDVTFEKLGKAVNYGIANYNACISGDGKTMVFIRKMKFYDAVFYCIRSSDTWSDPENITAHIGSDGEFYPTGLSFDGKRMLLTSYVPYKGMDVYESTCRNGKWTKVRKLNAQVNTAFNDMDGVYSPDGKAIYFSSNRTTGIGGYDIYTCSIDESGNCGPVENLGNVVNTRWDEQSPTFTDNGKILIFSSQRKPGMGGHDYFYTTASQDGKWKKVYNVGYPLSTVEDDVGFKTMLQSNEGVLAKYDPSGVSDKEIYKVKFSAFSKFSIVPVNGNIQVKKGTDMSFKGINLYFIDETSRDTVGTIEEPYEGKYSLDMYPGSFKLVMEKNNVQVMSQSFIVPNDSDGTTPIFQVFSELTKEPEKSVVVEQTTKIDTLFVADVLFEFSKSTIPFQEKAKLNIVLSKLKNYKINKIELVGYTDLIGSKTYNQNLSEQRAGNVSKCFTDQGFPISIVSTKGVGAENFVAKNIKSDGSDNPEGRYYNRRVEIHITPDSSNLIIIKKNIVPEQLKP